MQSLQCHIIFQKSFKETFLVIINVENTCAASYFCGKCDTFFQQNSIFFNIANVKHSTAHFDILFQLTFISGD